MTDHVAKLLAIASESIMAPPTQRPKLLAGERGDELWELLQQRNGFYAFESALYVFPAVELERWNAPALWRDHYDDLAHGCVFFAEDVFGGQFALAGDRVCTFDPETGAREPLGDSLDAWAHALLEHYETLTGQPLAHAWQRANGALPPNKRLVPKTPFVAGGELDLANLYAGDAVEAMRLRGDLAVKIRDLPDGAQISLEVGE